MSVLNITMSILLAINYCGLVYFYGDFCLNFIVHTVYKDTATPSPFIEQFPNDDGCGARSALPDHIYMDCMGFGMGCSCLQVTFQACDIEEARHLYDQLAVVCPVMVSYSHDNV